MPLNEPAPAVIEDEPDSDDGLPDLLDEPQALTDDQKKAQSVLQRTIQPWIRILGDFRMPLLHNVPTEEDFPPLESLPNRGILTSSNHQSLNYSLTSRSSVNSVIQLSNQSQSIQSSMQPTPEVYWHPQGIQADLPQRVMKLAIQRALANNSPNLTRRFYHHWSAYAHLPPMDEVRVRQWLRELYPYEFRAYHTYAVDQDSSLELAEIRCLFQALLNESISLNWFNGPFFTPPLAESLALLLRNQIDRFLLDFYNNQDLTHPRSQATHRLIARTVIQHIAFSNQRTDWESWRTVFYEEDRIQATSATQPNLVDTVVLRLLQGYHNRPFHPVPDFPPIYDTHDLALYDTLKPSYRPRQHLIRPSATHVPNATNAENPANMLVMQERIEQPPFQSVSAVDVSYLQFRLCHHMTAEAIAELPRDVGPIYNLLTLYTGHNGPLRRLTSNLHVRGAITQYIQRDYVRHHQSGRPNLLHNGPFTHHEFRCLLQALLSGALQPSQYEGRMLPDDLVNQLRYYVDQRTQVRIDYAQSVITNPLDIPLDMFLPILECDTIMHITTDAWPDLVLWFESFRRYALNPNCSNPAMLLRNAIQQQSPMWHAQASALVSVEMYAQRNSRMDTITRYDTQEFPESHLQHEPYETLQSKVIKFQQTIQGMPYRYVPTNRVRAERSQYALITEQFQAALGSPYGRPLHLRSRKYLQEQEFLFRANVQEQLNRYSRTPAYDYSGTNDLLPTYSEAIEPILQDSSEEDPIKSPYDSENSWPPSPPRSPNTLRLLQERKQAALRRQEELTPITSSRASRTTDRINAQIQIDTAEGTTGTSSSSSTSSQRSTDTIRNSSAYEEARTSTPDATTTAIAQRTRSQHLRSADNNNMLTQPQSDSTPPAPSSIHDIHRG